MDDSDAPGGSEAKRDGSARIRIAVVGACAAGKSTLVDALTKAGYEARHVAQEHSYVPAMWQRVSKPDLLVYLDVDYRQLKERRPTSTMREADLLEQKKRLAHARQHCDFYIDTSGLAAERVKERVLAFLNDL